MSTQPVAQDNAPAAAPVDAAPASAPDGPAAPTTVLEALEQRLAKYAEQRDKAKVGCVCVCVRPISVVCELFC